MRLIEETLMELSNQTFWNPEVHCIQGLRAWWPNSNKHPWFRLITVLQFPIFLLFLPLLCIFIINWWDLNIGEVLLHLIYEKRIGGCKNRFLTRFSFKFVFRHMTNQQLYFWQTKNWETYDADLPLFLNYTILKLRG